MVTHMKTTVDISDNLFQRTRRLAAKRGVTMRALIEEGLQAVLRQDGAQRSEFTLRDASFRGSGLAPGVSLENWDEIRALIHEGRGG